MSRPASVGLFARRGLDRGVHTSWRSSVEATGRNGERVLAWAPIEGQSGTVVGSVGVLSVLFADLVGEQSWRHVGWHEIETGEWNGETAELRWKPYGGARGSVRLDPAGRLPELFRERIAASIAVEETLEVGHNRRLIISGRRDLSHPDRPLIWQRTLSRGLSAATPGLDDLTEATLARLRSEYDPG